MSKITSLDAHKNKVSKQLRSELDATAINVQEVQSKLAEVSTLVLDAVLDDLRNRKVSGYNASCILSNVLTSFTRVFRLRLEIIDRLTGITPKEHTQEENDNESLEQKETRRMAEAMLSKLLRNKYGDGSAKEGSTAPIALPKSKVAAE